MLGDRTAPEDERDITELFELLSEPLGGLGLRDERPRVRCWISTDKNFVSH
jgi:hypothetical protein